MEGSLISMVIKKARSYEQRSPYFSCSEKMDSVENQDDLE